MPEKRSLSAEDTVRAVDAPHTPAAPYLSDGGQPHTFPPLPGIHKGNDRALQGDAGYSPRCANERISLTYESFGRRICTNYSRASGIKPESTGGTDRYSSGDNSRNRK